MSAVSMHMNIFNVPMYVSSDHSERVFPPEVLSVAFSPDGNTIASGSDDNSIKLWNPQTGDLIRTLDGNRDMLLCIFLCICNSQNETSE